MTTENTAPKKTAAQFQRRRKISRTMAVQFLYQLDARKDWTLNLEEKEAFQYLAKDAAQEELAKSMISPDQAISQEEIDASWDFAEKLIQNVVENREELDRLITEAAANWTLSRMGAVDRAILRLEAYEITHGDNNVSPATAINEGVELAKLFGQPESPRFINGVLDKIRRNAQK